jgi:hypothetical protein
MIDWSVPVRWLAERRLQSVRSRLNERGRILIHYHPTQPHRSIINAGAGIPLTGCLLFAVVWTATVGLIMLL